MNNTNQFINPYRACHKQPSERSPTRLNMDISVEDYDFIRCLRTSTGTMTTTVGILYKKLINELKRRNITDVTKRSEFEHFVVNCELTCPDYKPTEQRSTSRGTDQQAASPNVQRREEGTSGEDTKSAHEQPSVQSSTSGQGGSKRSGKQSKRV